MEKLTVIIPSYPAHFQGLNSLLLSAQRNLIDLEEVQFKIVIGSGGLSAVDSIYIPDGVNAEVVTIQTILGELGIGQPNDDALYKRIGKYNYQSIKKLFATLRYGSNWTLLMDSEHFILRKCRLNDILNNFMLRKQQFYSPFFGTPLQGRVTETVTGLLGVPFEQKWLFEVQSWFIEKQILQDMVNHFGGEEQLYATFFEKRAVFEMVLYHWFIYSQPGRYGYQFTNCWELLEAHMGDKFLPFLGRFRMFGLTMLEFCCIGLMQDNLNLLSKFYADMNISFFRPSDDSKLHRICAEFIKMTPEIKILACSPRAVEFAAYVVHI